MRMSAITVLPSLSIDKSCSDATKVLYQCLVTALARNI